MQKSTSENLRDALDDIGPVSGGDLSPKISPVGSDESLPPDIDLRCGGESPVISEGIYEAICFGYNPPKYLWGRHILFLHFQIIQNEHFSNEHFGTKVWMVFNLTQKKKIPPGSKYWRAWCIANGGKPKRGDRMSPRVFLRKRFLISVVTVKKDPKQKNLPDFLHYSIGRNIVGKLS